MSRLSKGMSLKGQVSRRTEPVSLGRNGRLGALRVRTAGAATCAPPLVGENLSKNKGKIMCSPKLWCVLLVSFCIAPGPLAFAQNATPAGGSTTNAASEEEVQQLRREVAELKALIQRLAPAGSAAATGTTAPTTGAVAPTPAGPPAANAPTPATRADVDALQKEVTALQKKAAEPPPAATAGWNG